MENKPIGKTPENEMLSNLPKETIPCNYCQRWSNYCNTYIHNHPCDCKCHTEPKEVAEPQANEWESKFRKMMGKALITLDVIMIRDFIRETLADQKSKWWLQANKECGEVIEKEKAKDREEFETKEKWYEKKIIDWINENSLMAYKVYDNNPNEWVVKIKSLQEYISKLKNNE